LPWGRLWEGRERFAQPSPQRSKAQGESKRMFWVRRRKTKKRRRIWWLSHFL